MKQLLSRSLAWGPTAALLLGMTGCAGLLPKPPIAPMVYTLDDPSANAASLAFRTPDPTTPLTLAVHVPRAASGYDSARIVYTRQAPRLDAYANSVWVDTPAQMLTPMLVAAMESTGAFAAVVAVPSAARADIELDTQILRLQQDFGHSPSRARVTLRATLVDSRTRQVIASQEFDAAVDSASEDARGGVVAAHRAVHQVLAQLAVLCSDVAARGITLINERKAERSGVRP